MSPSAEKKGGVDDLLEELRPEDASDEHRAAFDRAMMTELANAEDPDSMGGFLLAVHRQRPHMGAGHLITQARRSTSDVLLGYEAGFPEKHVTEEAWINSWGNIFSDSELRKRFEYDMLHRELQSNVPDRYKGLKTFANIARQVGRLSTCHVLDVGTSQAAGLNYIAFGRPFNEPRILMKGSKTGTLDIRHIGAFFSLMNGDLELDLSVGIDLEPREASRKWARSCSFEPAELLDPERVAVFDEMLRGDHPNVRFYQADYANFNQADFEESFPGLELDIVHACTSLYQADPDAQLAMIENAKAQAGEFVIVQDFVKITNDGRDLQFRKNWRKVREYPYRTLYWDMESKNPSWQEAFRWTDGRVRELDIGLGRIATSLGKSTSIFRVLDRVARRAG